MPTSEAPAEVNEPKGPADSTPKTGSPTREIAIPGGILGLTASLDPAPAVDVEPEPETELEPGSEPTAPRPRVVRGSRWVDYDTHELLEMISELEDERRWSRLREGLWLAILIHVFLLSAITWIPTYLFKVPKVVDPFDALKEHSDQTFLNLPPDILKQRQKLAPKPLPKQPLIDKKTLDEFKSEAPPPPPAEQQPAPVEPKPQASQPIPPSPQSQQPEAPRPSAVPARPNFAMGPQNPSDQLRQDMMNSMHGHGQQGSNMPSGGLSMHPGAGTGAPDILSDTQGVDFSSWLARWHYITQMTWDPLIPDEVNPPILKSGVVAIRFRVLPNGQVVNMTLDGRSGDTGLDRAAWGAITGSSYPPLPREFHGPYLELRAYFLYNMQPR